MKPNRRFDFEPAELRQFERLKTILKEREKRGSKIINSYQMTLIDVICISFLAALFIGITLYFMFAGYFNN